MKLKSQIYIFFLSLLFVYPFSLLFSVPALANTDFTVQTIVNPSNTLNTHILSVSNFGGNHVWAVGYYLDQNFQEQAIIESYNGSSWVQQTAANLIGSNESKLLSVKALSANDIWAVGSYSGGVLIEHSTDGGNTWVQDTDSYIGGGTLNSIDGDSSTDDAWAVGYDDQANPVTLHLVNGHFISQSNVNIGQPTELYSVSEYNNNDVWATGYYVASDGSNDWIPLSMHWEQVNGTYQWVVKTTPNLLNSNLNVVTGVVDIGNNDAWAIEDDQNGSTILMHWNGTEWSNPVIPPSGTELTGVVATSSNNIWASLDTTVKGLSSVWQTQDGGSTWSNLSIETPGDIFSNRHVDLIGITVDQNTGNAWTIGSYVNSQPKFVSVIEGKITQNNSLVTAINAGGSTQGNYAADTDYSGGTTYSTTDSVDTSNVDNPAPQAVYQTVRYGNFSYTIPNLTANGTYTVRLHFNELYWNAAGQRTFNVSLNGTQVLSNFDIYQTAGGKDKALVEQFPATADSNGNITIQFTGITDNAMVNGIEVYNGSLPTPTPTPSPTPVQTTEINAGGTTTGDYQADNGYTGGTTYSTTASIDTSNVTDPAPQSVYQTVRYGNFTYTIPTNSPNTNYTVRLDFAEPYFSAAGQRTFNVTINGTQDLSNFDVYQAAGGENKGVAEQFTTTTDSNGLIHIQFASVTDNAMVSGIAVSQQ